MATRDAEAPRRRSGVTESEVLGGFLGMAIGDALGMPLVGLSAAGISDRYGEVDGYLPWEDEREVVAEAGEFTDETEVALCIVEALTTNRGAVDPDLIGARMGYLAAGASRRWLSEETRRVLDAAGDRIDPLVPYDDDGPATGDVASRGIPIGLMAAVGPFDEAWLRASAETVTRLTHGSPAAIAATTAVAYAVSLAARRDVSPGQWAAASAAFLGVGELADRLGAGPAEMMSDSGTGTGGIATMSVPAAIHFASMAGSFEEAVFPAVRAGGASDTVGAIAGALAGARFGAGAIPQGLIDGLGGRIYVSLAAPWYYKASLQRAGMVISIRPEGENERPAMPPRR
ncbi:MAG: ADP-ribosylglycohydrolase family protein [Chloroflexota bacterium]|nr:ADP-ribosylglycohydrolase family protein [Chloroflexota bacterium]